MPREKGPVCKKLMSGYIFPRPALESLSMRKVGGEAGVGGWEMRWIMSKGGGVPFVHLDITWLK